MQFDSIPELVAECKKRRVMIHCRMGGDEMFIDLDGGRVPLADPANPKEPVQRYTLDDGTARKLSEDICVPESLNAALVAELKNEESELRKISTWPVTRHFLYVDISGFSSLKPGMQALVINTLIGLVDDEQYWSCFDAGPAQKAVRAKLCIGDGYIFVFDQADSLHAVYFAAHLAALIQALSDRKKIPEFHFRMGLHVGEVYSFWDSGRNDWNFIGDGINGGNRVLATIGKDLDDVIFISEQVRQRLSAQHKTADTLGRFMSCLENRGRHKDKHGNPWRVHLLNHAKAIGARLPTQFQ